MTTVHCPKSHVKIAESCVGKPYGHVPGHQYHDVETLISAKSGRYRVHVVESWGSAQGYDEEHGRREVIGRGDCLRDAIDDAGDAAKTAGMDESYLIQSLHKAMDEAEEWEAD